MRAYACGSCPSLEQEEFRLLFGSYIHVGMRACVRAWANVAGDPPSKDSNQKTNKQCIHSSKKKKNRGIALASIACISQSVSPTAHPASGGGQSVVRTSSSRRSSRP